jgi:uncharacterized protein (TIGR02147 family)
MPKEIFAAKDYKKFLLDRLKSLPKKGRGQMLKIAKYLRVHPSLLSQILKGNKDLTQEQAIAFADYLGLTPIETDCFLLLLLEARAGTQELRKYYSERLRRLRLDADSIDHRIEDSSLLSDSIQQRFYSHWYYSAIRLLTSVPPYHNIDSIAERLRLPRKTVSDAVAFLVESGLCVQEEGKIKLGPQQTHVKSTSPLAQLHHQNWRLQTTQQIPFTEKTDLLFTAPVSVSLKDFRVIRDKLLDTIDACSETIKNSPEEELAVLNIDWYVFRG